MQARDATASDWDGWADGTHDAAYEILGARPTDAAARTWTLRVWAPNATSAAVVGDHNGWDGAADPMERGPAGTWHTTIEASAGMRYKFRLGTGDGVIDKADPFALHTEEPPATGSVLWDLGYDWQDAAWMAGRGERQAHDQPISIYEVHLGSWDRPASYRGVADDLIAHLQACGFTHVEFLPVMEHPYYGSWGYQSTGYFAPSCRYGSPEDLMWLIDRLHGAGIGVILDWVPSHFPADEFALARFDGTALFEHPDPRRGWHPDWRSYIFDHGRPEVRAFLISSARFWLERYHADALRVDAVASMLYRDYSRGPGEWEPNIHGGNENLEAIAFLRQLNQTVYRHFPDVHTIAEESTAFPGVSRRVDADGLGFGFKWDMGWMHDTLEYLQRDPEHRRYHHDEITRPSGWSGAENYVLPLSHDEVVHEKRSLLGRMPGDQWLQAAGLRLLLGWQWAHPGKKLLFMGGELGLAVEWDHEGHLPWRADDPARPPIADPMQAWVGALNRLYRDAPALYAGDNRDGGFAWIVGDDAVNSVCAFLRGDPTGSTPPVLVIANFTAETHESYVLGVPLSGVWTEVLSGDDPAFGGSGVVNAPVLAGPEGRHGYPHHLVVRVPPLGVSFWQPR